MALAKCQLPDNQYVQTLKTTVLACRPYVPPAPAAGAKAAGKDAKDKGAKDKSAAKGGDAKGKDKAKDAKAPAEKGADAKAAAAGDAKDAKDGAAAGAAAGAATGAAEADGPQYEVLLADTVLFPVGGGQPCDYGTIGAAKVVDVYRATDGAATPAAGPAPGTGAAVTAGAVLHRTTAPVAVGAAVDVAVDWARRWDHMQCHTGQHLISAVAMNEFGWKTASWCLTEAPRECYIEFDTPDIADEQWSAFEAKVNAAIRDARPTKVHVFGTLEAAMKSELGVRSKGIPADIKGPVRLIEIAGTDFNTCCGTHLKTTAEIQVVNFTRKEKARKHTIIHFVAGNRAIDMAARAYGPNGVSRKLGALLSCGAEKHVEVVTGLQASLKAANKSKDKLIKELGAAQALGLVLAAADGRRKWIAVHRDDDAGAAYPAALIEAVTALGDAKTSPTGAAVAAAKDLSVFASDEETGQYVLSGPAAVCAKHGPEISKLLSGRGGGKGRYQGKAGAPLNAAAHAKVIEYLKAQAELNA